jgi:hypothetical protein
VKWVGRQEEVEFSLGKTASAVVPLLGAAVLHVW